MYRYDKQQLSTRIGALTPRQRLAFSVTCAERLFPNYVAFSRESGWGDPALLRAALDAAWDHLRGTTTDPPALRELLKLLEGAIPDAERFEGTYVSAGLNAGCAAAYLVELLLGDDRTLPKSIAGLSHETVNQLDTAPTTRHHLLQTELLLQEQALTETQQLGHHALADFEARWRNVPTSNIGVSAEPHLSAERAL